MFDAQLIPLQRRLIRTPALWLVQRGISADQVTLAGFALGMCGVAALALQAYGVALICLILNRIGDGLDGEIARQTRPTDRGAFLDIALDFLFYAMFPLGFALGNPEAFALPAAVLIASFVGTGSSFLAFSLIADRRGLSAADYPTKGIYYLGGLTEGAETIALFILICLFPASFPLLAYAFAIACFVTTALRWYAGWRMFEDVKAR